MDAPTYDVAIVGGGIAGLSAAWYMQEQAKAANLDLRYVLLEACERWGGHIRTERVSVEGSGDFVVEAGPDSFITQKPHGMQLARELGLDERLLGTNDRMRRVYVLNRGRPTPLPDGVLLIVPTRVTPFALSPLISPLGKLRMGMDLILPARRGAADETLADFVRRRLGREALDKIAEPLLSGIYNAEADRQSLLATFPRFRALEEEYGSLTRGMIASRRSAHRPAPASNGGKISTFMSLRGGTEELVNTLRARLRGDLQTSAPVREIRRDGAGGFVLQMNDAPVRAHSVVLATPAFSAAELLKEVAPDLARDLQTIRYVSTGTLSLAFRTSDIRRPLNGFGLVVPRSERRPINAVTISSVKFDGRAPEGYSLLRAFFGGSRSPQSMELTDAELLTTVRAEMRALFGIEAAPLFHRIYRGDRSNAQYDVGHLDRLSELEKSIPAGIHLTGSAYRGVGIPDCIRQSQETASQVISNFQRRKK